MHSSRLVFCTVLTVAQSVSAIGCAPDLGGLSGARALSRAPEEGTSPTGSEPGSVAVDRVAGPCPTPAGAVFGNALCLCEDFKGIGNLLVTSGESGSLGSVGVNGVSSLTANTRATGSWASGGAVTAIGTVDVGTSLYTPASLTVGGLMAVGKNVSVGGNVEGFGMLRVGGSLDVKGEFKVLGMTSATRGTYVPRYEKPCACGPNEILDIDARIAAAKANNDNAQHGLSPSFELNSDVTLKSGRYYVTAVRGFGLRRVTIDGAVSLFVDGPFESTGNGNITFVNGGTLDLYLGDSVQTIGNFSAGDPGQAGALRIYRSGTGTIDVSVGNQAFHGLVYAPRATIRVIGNTLFRGGLFARTLDGLGNLEIAGVHPVVPDTPACRSAGPGTVGSEGQGPGSAQSATPGVTSSASPAGGNTGQEPANPTNAGGPTGNGSSGVGVTQEIR